MKEGLTFGFVVPGENEKGRRVVDPCTYLKNNNIHEYIKIARG